MSSEILFKPVPNFEDYLIDKNGNTYSIKRKKFLKPYDQGYFTLGLYNKGKLHKVYLHRILGLTFIDNPDNKPCIDHIDRNKKNNKLENLRWANYVENRQNSNKNFNNKIGHKHITLEFYDLLNGRQGGRYRIKIITDNIKVSKNYDINKFNLNQVVEKRNEILTNMNLLISD